MFVEGLIEIVVVVVVVVGIALIIEVFYFLPNRKRFQLIEVVVGPG